MSNTSPGPNTARVPSAKSMPSRPGDDEADVPGLAPLAADVGRTCFDQRQPGSLTSSPTVRSPSSTILDANVRELDDLVGLLEVLRRRRRPRASERRPCRRRRRSRASPAPSAIGIVAMKTETGSPMSSTPSVCQKPSTSNAHTIAPMNAAIIPNTPTSVAMNAHARSVPYCVMCRTSLESLTRRAYSARAWIARTVSIVSASAGDLSGR